MPGSYLGEAHTRAWWRHEQYPMAIADHAPYAEWMSSGRPAALDHAQEKVQEIMATHRPLPLTAAQEDAIEAILGEARDYYRREGFISDQEWTAYQSFLAEQTVEV